MLVVLAWELNQLARSDAEELARAGLRPLVLYPWSGDEVREESGVLYRSVAITVKTNTNFASAVLASIGDFARAISWAIYDSGEEVSAFYGHEWMGSTIASAFKDYLRRPLFTSLTSTEGMRSVGRPGDLLSMAIGALERRALHKSDLVLARGPEVLLRVKEEHEVPGDSARLARSSAEAAAAIRGFLHGSGLGPEGANA